MKGWDRFAAVMAGMIIGLLVATVATTVGTPAPPQEPMFCQCSCTLATAAPSPPALNRGAY